MKIKKGKLYQGKPAGIIILATQNSTSDTFSSVVVKNGNNSSKIGLEVGSVSECWDKIMFKEYSTEIVEYEIDGQLVILKLDKKQRKIFKKLTSEYPNKRFIPYKKGWLDMTTGLLWEKFQDKETYTFEQVIKIKKGKYKLPTIEQLETLVDKSINKSSTKLPDIVSNNYWSSSTYVGSFNFAWVVGFVDGNSNYDSKTSAYYVRCVKAGPLGLIQ